MDNPLLYKNKKMYENNNFLITGENNKDEES